MKQLKNSLKAGFTIVELIVVIVVIAILAVVSIVAYNGIQEKAYNAQIISGVSQYRDAIESYKVHYGYYPRTTREIAAQEVAVACLGEGYDEDYCGRISGVDIYEDPAFNAELRKVGGGPAISADALQVGSESFTGAVYGIDFVDYSKSPTGYARTIQYATHGGSTDCKLKGAWSYNLSDNPPITACEIILEIVPAPIEDL
ncbi:MAG: prepilin-type N-terminal cleavage/methylation domain-containing protein [Candidatus Microsaccharimonas sp.]